MRKNNFWIRNQNKDRFKNFSLAKFIVLGHRKLINVSIKNLLSHRKIIII